MKAYPTQEQLAEHAKTLPRDDTATLIRWLYFACGLGLGWLL